MSSDNLAARRNAVILALAMGFAGANAAVVFATAALVGQLLAPSAAWATAPITSFVIGTAIATLPAAFLMRRIGRRDAYRIGAGLGVIAGLLAAYALREGQFIIFMLATALCGAYQAFVVSYRFAAADQASPDFRAKAVSYVLLGGLAAAVVGPQLVIFTKDLSPPHTFFASYLVQALVAGLAMLALSGLRDAPVISNASDEAARPLRVILRNQRLIVAIICGAISQAMMNLIMTAAPLAMIGCAHSITDAALAIQWHIVGMYLPGFFTGNLINRFGVYKVMIFGMVLLGLSGVVALMGITVAHFFVAMSLLGLGWNFAFVGATVLVTEGQRPNERNKVQGFNDLVIFSITAVASLLSGKVIAAFGWGALNTLLFPCVIGASLMVIWLAWDERRRRKAVPV